MGPSDRGVFETILSAFLRCSPHLLLSSTRQVGSIDNALFTAGDEMPIWADILSCNGFEPEGSCVLHSIVCRVSRGGGKVSRPPLRPERRRSRERTSTAQNSPLFCEPLPHRRRWSTTFLIQNQANGRPCHRHGRLRTMIIRRQIVTRLRVVSCPRDCAQKRLIHK